MTSRKKSNYEKTLKIVVVMGIITIIVGIIAIISMIDKAINYREKEKEPNIIFAKQPFYIPQNNSEMLEQLPIYKKVSEQELNVINYNCLKQMFEDFINSIECQNNDFNFINTQINGWTINYDTQKYCYDSAGGNKIKYIYYQSIIYNEGAKNNNKAIHHNENGTIDYGEPQINSCNISKTAKYNNGIEDMEVCFDRRKSVMIMRDILQENINYYKNYFDATTYYNAGGKTIKNLSSGKWSDNCVGGRYAKRVMQIMMHLLNVYNNEV